MEPDALLVSEPVAAKLAERDDVAVGPLEPLSFDDDGMFDGLEDPYALD